MAHWHGYIGLEDIALTPAQRAAIIEALRALGPVGDNQPAHLMQFRASLDRKKAIFEALFDTKALTVDRIRQYLADAAGVSVAVVDATTQQTDYGPLVTYSVNAINRIRGIAFGSVGCSWDESRAACQAYIRAHQSEWDVP